LPSVIGHGSPYRVSDCYNKWVGQNCINPRAYRLCRAEKMAGNGTYQRTAGLTGFCDTIQLALLKRVALPHT